MRLEDRLQGAQNFPTWKERITRIMDVSDAEEHIDSTKVAPTDPTDLVAWKKIDSRSMLISMALESIFFQDAKSIGFVGATFVESMCSSASLTSRIPVILSFHVGKF